MYTTPLAGAFTNLSVSNAFSLGGGGNNNAKYEYNVYEVADDFDMVRGTHQITFGVNYLHQVMHVFNTQYSNGQFTFDGSVTGLSLADFLVGRVGQVQQGADVHLNERAPYVATYVQDAWKASWMPKLTSEEVPINPYRIVGERADGVSRQRDGVSLRSIMLE